MKHPAPLFGLAVLEIGSQASGAQVVLSGVQRSSAGAVRCGAAGGRKSGCAALHNAPSQMQMRSGMHEGAWQPSTTR